MDPIDAQAAADQLYAAAPEDFVARRNELAKQAKAAGDAEAAAAIKELRKPTAAAWLANRLSREHADEIADLLLLGDELRAASATLNGDRLRELSPRRQDAVRGLVRQARALAKDAGRQVSADVAQKLSETLDAALVDPAAAAAVRAGQLTTALRHVGFGLVDESGEPTDLSNVVSIAQARAVREPAAKAKAATTKARPEPEPEPVEEEPAPAKETAAQRRKREEAEEAFADAETELDQADATVSELSDELDRRKQAVKDAQAEVERLAAELEDAREELDSARRAVRRGGEELDDARKDARTARRQHREAKLAWTG
jgi:hypothetical protein